MMGLGSVELLIILAICVVLLVLPVTLAIVLAMRQKGGARRPCPYCAEAILPEAGVCRYCGRELPPGWSKNG